MNAIISGSDVDFSVMSDRQIASIEFIVCATALDVIPVDVIVIPCCTGCGTFIYYQQDIPEVIPKVCRPCSKWLLRCVSE